MVDEQQLPDTLVADAVLAGQDEGVGEELLAAGADQLPLDVLDGNLETEAHVTTTTCQDASRGTYRRPQNWSREVSNARKPMSGSGNAVVFDS